MSVQLLSRSRREARHARRIKPFEGRVRSEASPDGLARLLVSVMQGLAIRARGGTPRDELKRIADEAVAVFGGIMRADP
jgi:hypothetical protein